MRTLSATRLYASSIAIVSGLCSVEPALNGLMGGTAMSTGEFIMLGIGVVVIVHGVLLTLAAARLGMRTAVGDSEEAVVRGWRAAWR